MGRTLVISADHAPNASTIRLADLRSRLGWGTLVHLKPLNDTEKKAMLTRRAAARGLHLPVAVADYLVSRLCRDPGTLCDTFDRLDLEALAAQRRLTIPFVRDLLRDPS